MTTLSGLLVAGVSAAVDKELATNPTLKPTSIVLSLASMGKDKAGRRYARIIVTIVNAEGADLIQLAPEFTLFKGDTATLAGVERSLRVGLSP